MTLKPWQLVAILAASVVLAAGAATGITLAFTLGDDGPDRPFGGRFGERFGMMHGEGGMPPSWGGYGPRMHGGFGDGRMREHMRGLLECLDERESLQP